MTYVTKYPLYLHGMKRVHNKLAEMCTMTAFDSQQTRHSLQVVKTVHQKLHA